MRFQHVHIFQGPDQSPGELYNTSQNILVLYWRGRTAELWVLDHSFENISQPNLNHSLPLISTDLEWSPLMTSTYILYLSVQLHWYVIITKWRVIVAKNKKTCMYFKCSCVKSTSCTQYTCCAYYLTDRRPLGCPVPTEQPRTAEAWASGPTRGCLSRSGWKEEKEVSSKRQVHKTASERWNNSGEYILVVFIIAEVIFDTVFDIAFFLYITSSVQNQTSVNIVQKISLCNITPAAQHTVFQEYNKKFADGVWRCHIWLSSFFDYVGKKIMVQVPYVGSFPGFYY